MSTVEDTPQWVEYTKLNAKARGERHDLISQALVQAYVQIDKDLLLMEEGGLMVCLRAFWCILRSTYTLLLPLLDLGRVWLHLCLGCRDAHSRNLRQCWRLSMRCGLDADRLYHFSHGGSQAQEC